MLRLLRSESYKLLRTGVVWALPAAPLAGLLSGVTQLNIEADINQWYLPLLVMNMIYALLFLPLITGVFAGMVCRYEHQAGGWKQLLALPVTRGQVYAAKYITVLLLIGLMQLTYLATIYIVGRIQGFTDPFPLDIVLKSIIGGWIATFPLAALQLWLSMVWKSFAMPFAVNVIFTLPTILVINSDKAAPYYPWAQPFSMMYIGGGEGDVFFVPWEQLITVVGGSFLLFFIAGYVYFQRKAV
ncbi:hypothetical protein PRECH8_06960 [Insulibacter thermoxylanivorax]|uniref:ABC transporter permease n=1 Tax=Insulibacter thermoxylanivorax TaxID=2749268 RepID=A0A916VGD2_9BACL|nr:ABC transporter permease [Insulibacter thermoxylanivorax]GFR37400.1 hypothetical protein PRECH8_06960 [Insulibacter thermoxylanivorax]